MGRYSVYQILLYFLGSAVYLTAAGLGLFRVWKKRLDEDSLLSVVFAGGMLLNLVFLIWVVVEGGEGRVPNKFETIVAFTTGIVFMSLLLEYYSGSPLAVVGGLTLAILMNGFGTVLLLGDQTGGLDVSFQSWLITHVGLIIFAYIVFTMGFISGTLFLLQDRLIRSKKAGFLVDILPSLERAESISTIAVYVGFPLLTLGIFLGILGGEYFYKHELTSDWYRDPKVLLSLLTWGVYGVVLSLHRVMFVKGKKFAYLSVFGFILILFTMFVSEFLWQGFHSFL